MQHYPLQMPQPTQFPRQGTAQMVIPHRQNPQLTQLA
jgi:hypothetical protein